MKKRNFLLIAVAAIGLSSFAKEENTAVKTGVFGGDGSNAPQITLNEEGSFFYKDLTRAKNPIEASGTYSVKHDKLILSDYPTENKLQDEWNIVRDGQCLKAKQKFAFYTLCNCSN